MITRAGTSEKLLEATLKLISEKGYLGTTTKEIAQEAGVTEVTLFRHFGSKERLFEEVLRRYSFLPKLRDLLAELEGGTYDYEKVLQIIGIRFFDTLKERKSFVRLMTCEINVYPEKVRDVHSRFIDEIIRVLADFFRSQQDKGGLRRFPSESAAKAFLGMIFSYFNVEEITKGREISREEMERTIGEFIDIFVHGTLKGG